MELKDTLRAISDDARGWLKAWARDFTEEEARRSTGESRAPNPLAWQLGHLACTEEDVAGLFTTGSAPAPLVPESLRRLCSTRPSSIAPRVANRYFHTLGQGIYEAALHENYHVGEIAALRKALGKPRIG
jgi:hypothetical protein